MKKILSYTLVLVALFPISELLARETVPAGRVQMKDVFVQREDGKLKITADLFADVRDFDPQMMLTVTPLLVNGTDTLRFDPVVLTGRKRVKAFKRQVAFGRKVVGTAEQEIIRPRKNTAWNCPLSIETVYRDWMSDAKFVLHEDASGCAKWDGYRTRQQVGDPLLSRPVFELVYVEPPIEEIKQRSNTYSAYINYVVAKYDLLPNFRNNANVLAGVDEILTELRNDPNLNITELTITGYASPEGGYDSNMKLSENRAKAFVNYLKERYRNQIPAGLMGVSWKGEDWEGLRKQIEESDLADKAALLEILNEPDNITRKNRLKQLNGGRSYAEILNKYYPVLRRNDYTVAYVSKPFSVQEAREVIKTKPEQLSLNEMYHVANSYPRNSREFRETMDIISRFYPNDEIVVLNESIAQIENGEYGHSFSQLQRIDRPEAWNALGVAYYYRGDFTESAEFFRKAARSGLSSGAKNTESLEKSISNRF